jgi:hypothetical protein
MTIIHGFTSFNTVAPRFEIRAFVNGDTGADKGSCAGRLARFSPGFHGQSYRVEDYGWALSGRNTIDLYMANQRELNP